MTAMPQFKERWSGVSYTRPNDPRSPADRDLARIIHSASYRRLQSKTQVLGLGESDFYRTRLTHSNEVAQIAAGIKRQIEPFPGGDPDSEIIPDVPTITAIALAHDIGHPPFGHGGEVALQYMMRTSGGFEGNAQTLRILARLEPRTESHGLDLTRRTLLGVFKYPSSYKDVINREEPATDPNNSTGISVNHLRTLRAEDWKPPKCYYETEGDLVKWILKPFSSHDRCGVEEIVPPTRDKHGKAKHRSLDATIMDVADDISYAVHDLEDAIHMRFVSVENGGKEEIDDALKSCSKEWVAEFELNGVEADLFSDEKWRRKEAVGKLINSLVSSVVIATYEEFEHPLLQYRVELQEDAHFLKEKLKRLVIDKVICSPEVQTLEYRGQQIVMELFEAMAGDPKRLLPRDTKKRLAEEGVEETRVIADHISGMTDDYATRIYERLFTPRPGSLFQKM